MRCRAAGSASDLGRQVQGAVALLGMTSGSPTRWQTTKVCHVPWKGVDVSVIQA